MIRKISIIILALLATHTIYASVAPKRGVEEVVLFTTKKTVSTPQLITLAKQTNAILKTYPGFISRCLSQNVHHQHAWNDRVHWASLLDAQLAANKIIHTRQMKAYVATMLNYHMDHYTAVWSSTTQKIQQ